MDAKAEKFRQLLESAQKVLVTSHISPDPDAISSALLVGKTLRFNYPEKGTHIVLEEKPARKVDFLDGYQEIEFKPLLEATTELQPNLFIMVDAANFERVSRVNGPKLRQLLKNRQIKTATIDHHEQHGKDEVSLYINNQRPATAQEVYELLFEKLDLKKPRGYAEITLLGIISDTARHKFDNPVHRETFRVVSDLIDSGASIEELETITERYTQDQLEVYKNLLDNITDSGKGYTYSFIDDKFTSDWLSSQKPTEALKLGCEEFTNQFIKNYKDNLWGFVIHPELNDANNNYGVSLRSTSGNVDVSKLAYKLGGGGHKPAAGAKVKASNVDEALEKVKEAIGTHQ